MPLPLICTSTGGLPACALLPRHPSAELAGQCCLIAACLHGGPHNWLWVAGYLAVQHTCLAAPQAA